MSLINDNNCGWINDLPKRANIRSICKDENCDFLIVGAGYTGLLQQDNYQNKFKF